MSDKLLSAIFTDICTDGRLVTGPVAYHPPSCPRCGFVLVGSSFHQTPMFPLICRVLFPGPAQLKTLSRLLAGFVATVELTVSVLLPHVGKQPIAIAVGTLVHAAWKLPMPYEHDREIEQGAAMISL